MQIVNKYLVKNLVNPKYCLIFVITKRNNMHDTKSRLAIAHKLANTYRANIKFMEERLKIQADPNYDRYAKSGGQWSEKQYNEVQVELEKQKLAKALEVIEELS